MPLQRATKSSCSIGGASTGFNSAIAGTHDQPHSAAVHCRLAGSGGNGGSLTSTPDASLTTSHIDAFHPGIAFQAEIRSCAKNPPEWSACRGFANVCSVFDSFEAAQPDTEPLKKHCINLTLPHRLLKVIGPRQSSTAAASCAVCAVKPRPPQAASTSTL
jgi:hypothetical protein